MNHGTALLQKEFEKALSDSIVFSEEAKQYVVSCIEQPHKGGGLSGLKREFETALRESTVFSKSASVYLASHIRKESEIQVDSDFILKEITDIKELLSCQKQQQKTE